MAKLDRAYSCGGWQEQDQQHDSVGFSSEFGDDLQLHRDEFLRFANLATMKTVEYNREFYEEIEEGEQESQDAEVETEGNHIEIPLEKFDMRPYLIHGPLKRLQQSIELVSSFVFLCIGLSCLSIYFILTVTVS